MTSSPVFSIEQEKYKGPLETVIHLLRKRKLHVSDINLAQITEDFSQHVQNIDNTLPQLSDFVRVMSVLLLIKTKALLPKESLGSDDEETIAQFEADLIRVEALQEIKDNILLNQQSILHRKEKPKSVPHSFIPDEDLTLKILTNIAKQLAEETEREETFAKVAVARLANLKTTIETIERRLLSLKETDMKTIIPDSMATPDKVVHFIAILELLKQNRLTLIESEEDGQMLQYGHTITPTYGDK
tara:strand:- start:256 stop:987 length:732 start_codon:yes stop_codon:yes gene_type:complete